MREPIGRQSRIHGRNANWRELKLPVLYLGVGESADDLVDFRPKEFAAALLG